MSGSIRKFIWNGQTYPVKATSDFTENPEFEHTETATTGQPIVTAERKVPTVENIEIFADAVEKAAIRADIRNRVVSDMGYIEENGDSNYSKGRITEISRTTMESTMTLKLIPFDPWEVIPA
jgi:hypothetical protein